MGASRPGMQLRCCARRTGLSSSTTLGKNTKGPERGLSYFGGEGGIRTHGTGDRTPDFESGPFDHSGTSPLVRGAILESYGSLVKSGRYLGDNPGSVLCECLPVDNG